MLSLPTPWLALKAVARFDFVAVALGVIVIVGWLLGFTKDETETDWLAARSRALPRRRRNRPGDSHLSPAGLAAQGSAIGLLPLR